MYLATMTIKKTHEHLKHMWARVELGEQKYKRLLEQGNAIEMVCKNSINMPEIYMEYTYLLVARYIPSQSAGLPCCKRSTILE